MKNVLVVYNQMNTGGIETLILRFGYYFKANGHKLKVILTDGGGSLLNELKTIADVKLCNSITLSINQKTVGNDPFYENIDEVFTLCPEGNALGLRISLFLKIPFKVGVYHPEDYGALTSRFYRSLFNEIPDSCKLFMNDDCLISHERIFNRKINSEIWPLPVIVDPGLGQEKQREPKKNKIISIGRFDPFKTYNLTTIELVSHFKDKGILLKYDLYGYGLLEDKMKSLIKKHHLIEDVVIKGVLNYSDLKNVVKEAYIFVGCGTAAIEASYTGVPTIIAALGTNGLSNGLFTDEIGFNIGEQTNSLKTHTIEELIEYILNLSDKEYLELSKKHTEIAKNRYEATAVFEKYFKLPEVKITLNTRLKLKIFTASLYFSLYKLYKIFTKTLGLQKLKKTIKAGINKV